MTFEGKRPASLASHMTSLFVVFVSEPWNCGAPVCIEARAPCNLSSVAIRVASMFRAPVPYFKQLSLILPLIGLRASAIGSWAGFSAVPQPDHSFCAGFNLSRMSQTSLSHLKNDPIITLFLLQVLQVVVLTPVPPSAFSHLSPDLALARFFSVRSICLPMS